MKRSITYTAVITAALGSCLATLVSAQTPDTISSSSFAALTRSAPALANFQGNVYAAWKGQSSNQIWYAAGPNWTSQNRGPGSTSTAPALAVADGQLYLAWRGQSANPTDNLYFSVNTGSGGFSKQLEVNTSSGFPETTSSPALAANGSTLYLAYTTTSATIMLATYTGSGNLFTVASTPASSVTPNSAPAMAVYNDELYLAWLEGPAGAADDIMYATLSLSSGTWSSVNQVEGTSFVAQTSVAPALAVNSVPVDLKPASVLEIAYTAETSTPGAFAIYTSQLTASGWNPPGPIPPGPLAVANLTPALVNYGIPGTGCPDPNATFYYFDVAYTGTNDGIAFYPVSEAQIMPICHCAGGHCG